MKRVNDGVIAIVLLTLLAGCETTGGVDGELSGDQAGRDAESSGVHRGGEDYGAASRGYASGSEFSESDLNDPRSPLSKRVIYFLYDSAEIKPEFLPVIDAHARYLIGHPDVRVTLEGHADERGSREYNIALGEQRANSVARRLSIQGVDRGQVEIVSYGEEKPVSFNHDEAGWQLNRRVEIRYPGY